MIMRNAVGLAKPRAARAALAGGAAGCLLVALAACGSAAEPQGAGSATPTPGSPPPATASTTPATAPPTTAATAPPAVPAGAHPPCPTRYLQAKIGLTQGAAGSSLIVIDFTNIAHGVTCTLYGYPGISLAGGHPVTQIGQAATENPATPRQLVTLAPGQQANALLKIARAGNFPASECGPVLADYLQIFPPNQTTPIYLAFREQACAKPVKLLTVDAVIPGSGGSA